MRNEECGIGSVECYMRFVEFFGILGLSKHVACGSGKALEPPLPPPNTRHRNSSFLIPHSSFLIQFLLPNF